MPRVRTGTWKRSGDQFLIYVTLPKKLLPGVKERRLPGIPVEASARGRTTSDADLDKLAKLYTDRPDLALARLAEIGKLPAWVPVELVPRDALIKGASLNPVAASAAGSLLETTASYADRWLEWRDKQGLSSIVQYKAGLKNFVFKVKVGEQTIGEKPIATITRDDVKVVASALRDARADGKMADGTAAHYWKYFRSMLCASCDEDGEPSLRVRSDNPALGVKGPPQPKEHTRACFYPSEFLQFIECEYIPRNARRVVALAVYLLLRLGELKSLLCEDIDLEHETITIRRAYDLYRRIEKEPKNGKPRVFHLEPHVVPLLRVMIEEAGGTGPLCPVNPYRLTDRFAEYMKRVGFTRPELLERTRSHLALTMHGLRATGATWAARSGRYSPLELRRVLGHRKQETTDVYFDDAQLMGRNVGEVFPPLPACLLNRSGKRERRSQRREKTAAPKACPALHPDQGEALDFCWEKCAMRTSPNRPSQDWRRRRKLNRHQDWQ